MVYSITVHYIKGKLKGTKETILAEGDSKYCILSTAESYFRRKNSNGTPYDNEITMSWVKIE